MPSIEHLRGVELLAFLAVSGLVLLLFYLYGSAERRVNRRIDELSDDGAGSRDAAATGRGGGVRPWQASLRRLARHFLPDDQSERLRLRARLVQAGYYGPFALHVFFATKLLLMVAPVLAGVAAGLCGLTEMRWAVLYGALGGGIGTVAPGLWLQRRKARRQMLLSRSLPDFLDLLVTCLQSGLSLDGGLRRVTSELRLAHPVLAAEMQRARNEIDLGVTADAALQNLAERTGLEEIGTLATFVQQARQFGMSIAEALRTHADALRVARELRAEEQAHKTAVKILFPTLLFIFPAVFVVLAGPAAIQLSEKFAQGHSRSP